MLYRIRNFAKQRGFTKVSFLALISLTAVFIWMLIGFLLAAATGRTMELLQEWIRLQGFILLPIGGFLLAQAVSQKFPLIAEDVLAPGRTLEDYSDISKFTARRQNICMLFISATGSASLIALGFNGTGIIYFFLCTTAVFVCILAAFATVHALEMLIFAAALDKIPIKIFSYSPAESRELKRFAEYFTLFGVVITVGYLFALAATLFGTWNGHVLIIRSVQIFWPTIYVPLCLYILSYPHIALHRVVRKTKERTINSFQLEINQLLSDIGGLDKNKIDRINSLADLIDRIERTPNYVLNIKIITGSMFTLLVNLFSAVIPKSELVKILQIYVFGL